MKTTLTGPSSWFAISTTARVEWPLTSLTPKVESGKVVAMSILRSAGSAAGEAFASSGYSWRHGSVSSKNKASSSRRVRKLVGQETYLDGVGEDGGGAQSQQGESRQLEESHGAQCRDKTRQGNDDRRRRVRGKRGRGGLCCTSSVVTLGRRSSSSKSCLQLKMWPSTQQLLRAVGSRASVAPVRVGKDPLYHLHPS